MNRETHADRQTVLIGWDGQYGWDDQYCLNFNYQEFLTVNDRKITEMNRETHADCQTVLIGWDGQYGQTVPTV
ncbi:hypothetical protein TIFTF001_015114 [Ficus carica]|uniref:Uncharacterized protein n=1 Tax=Ficus carica TaxID=3494 RepID=A0AA88A577_FICCA|nr:hypothetical protein TIFTF001_015114 [Ficus carica]